MRLEAADKSEVAANRRAFQQKYQQRKHRKKYYALPWTIIPHRRLTLRGIRALYWRYVYMLSKVRARKAPRAVRGVMLDELKKLERYSQQYYFLRDNRRMKNALYGMRLRMLDVPDLYARQEIASVFAGEHYLDFAGLFDTIHAEDVQEMFRRWAQPNRSTMSVVEPK